MNTITMKWRGSIFVIILCVLMIAGVLRSQTPINNGAVQPVVPAWAMGTWTASDAAYNDVITQTEQLVKSNALTAQVVTQALKVAQRSKKPVAIALAAYQQFRLLQVDFPSGDHAVYQITQLLQSAPDVHSYQFSRIAFLLSVYDAPSVHPWLVPLGDRLLARNPTDPDLVYGYIRANMPNILSPDVKSKLLKYATNLVTVRPRNPLSYLCVLMVYDASFTSSGNLDDGQSSLVWLKRYRDAGPGDAQQKWADQEIATNQSLINDLSTGNLKQ